MTPIAIQLAALRLAPIQCKGWGYPVTTGLPTIDYYLSSDLMEPDNAQQHYSEKLVRLPNLALCYRKPSLPQYPKPRSNFGIDDDAFVFLSAHSLFTYLPQYDGIFPRIARKVSNAKFVFISHQSRSVTADFKKRLGAAFSKYHLQSNSYCLFLPRLNLEDFLSLNLASNVLLDTPDWSGGKTSLEGIRCGLPVVTLPGKYMRGRHAYAMLRMMGIKDTIAENIEQYIDIAVRLGIDDRFYLRNREQIRDNSDRLFDDYSVPAALETFFKKIKSRAEND
jgi:predicted O-linked N-acetylglucosamine transferase (SPINDLY family)